MDAETTRTAEAMIEEIEAIAPLIRAESDTAEEQRRLSDSVAAELRNLGCFRMFRPRERGGLGFEPVAGFRVVEALSRIDSAAGWNVALANANEPFGAWFADDTTEAVFGPPETTLAGAFFPPRKAVPVDGGYELTGQTSFNSNCHAANWLLGEAHIYDGEAPRVDENGVPTVVLTAIPMSSAEIVDNWDTLGMRGTGSHDVKVEQLFVPEERAVPFVPMETPSPAYSGPFHRMTVWPSVAMNAVPALGVAQAAIDRFVELAHVKTPAYTAKTLRERAMVQYRVALAEARLGAARAFLHDTFNAAWKTALEGRFLDMDERANCQQAASYLAIACAEAVDLVHSVAGTSAIRNDKPFQRYFRDMHVMTQHAFFGEARLEAVGQVRFGMDPDWDFFYV